MVMPGIGEIYVNTRSRLITALAISFVMMPVLSPLFPQVPGDIITMALAIMSEIMVGLFIGGLARMVHATLHIGGMIIAFQSSLASALLFDANQGSQGSVIGNFMTLVGVTLLFVTNSHYIIIQGVVDSYQTFDAGVFPITGDLAEMMAKTLSNGFMVAVKIASPLMVIGLCVYLGSGMLGRLMPQMQVFMVMLPAQIYISFTIFMATMAAGMVVYLRYFKEVMSIFLVD